MDEITVLEDGRLLTFTADAILRFHGGGFPGGVIHGLKAMQAAFSRLGAGRPLERRRIEVLTAFTGPGGRDAVECVTRAFTDGRYSVNRSLGGTDVLSDPPGPYLWRFGYEGWTAQATIRPGHVRPEFVALGATRHRTPAEEARLEDLKREMAERLRPLDPDLVYAVDMRPTGSIGTPSVPD
jgi:hypothetical protein